MKKQVLLLLAILSLSMINCKKDNSDDGDSYTKKTVPVQITTNDNSSTFYNLPQMIMDRINGEVTKGTTATTTKVKNYEYDKRHITKITINDGSDVKVSEYFYADKSKGILDSIVFKTNGQYSGVSKYQMSNGHIQQISTFDENGNLSGTVTFSNYNGDKPSQMSLYSVSSQGTLDISGNITYNGDDIASISLNGTFGSYSIAITETYTYDTKHAPKINVETMETPMVEKHNVLTITYQMSIGGVPYSSDTTTYTYTYNNDDFPISSTYSGSGYSGTEEYEYDDK